jgi:DNA-binding FadR family transcriptional regulator
MPKPNKIPPSKQGVDTGPSDESAPEVPVASTLNKGGDKMAERLARQLESEIMAMGWPVGEPLGSEPELIERFGVSRAVFREAVRIVEHHGAARMRRGPGGGLIVTAPDPDAVVQPVTLYLDYTDVSPQDLFDVRSSLELTCARIAAETIDEEGIRRLRDVLAREGELGAEGVAQGHPHELHIAIAEITGNAAMKLLVEILARLTYERTAHLEFEASELEEVHRAHTAIVEAIVSGDAALAQHRVGRHLAASTQYYHQRNEAANRRAAASG